MKENNRRDFLKYGAMLGATAVSTSLVPADANAKTPETVPLNRGKIKTRILGSGENTIEVSYGLGLGCMGMSFNRSFIPERDKSIALIRKAWVLVYSTPRKPMDPSRMRN